MLNYARATLEAVCDSNEALAKRNMAMFGGKACFTSVDEMLDKASLDGVIIVGPPELHYEAGMKALRRGLPTLVEKPTAPDLARTQEMVAAAVRVQGRLNGETMQDASTALMIFNVPFLISYLSRGMTLLPGTLLLTGTPAGVGFARKPPVFLKSGDVFEVDVEGLGTLRNPVMAEQ